ncbi:MAG: anthranilate synthase component I family protein [Crocinitomicaceae bacterium]|nr:anthranilate synthase component I family protein [Crocinitomicaceae bacterium]MCF8410008.1 anthranilate synthase component I family protein [Crocinitomicaceae bacterium]MCF8445204.1 anthranilate synthase component I family protein [Crocinitomicaceae bacterium]
MNIPVDFPIAYLNSNDGSAMLAFGEIDSLTVLSGCSWELVDSFLLKHADKYIFGGLNYNLKNEVESLSTRNKDQHEFPLVQLFVPACVVKLDHENFEFLQGDKNNSNFEFLNYFLEEETDQNFHLLNIDWKSRTTKERYLYCVEELKKHIALGDIYEINYCQEFFAEGVKIDYPLDFYFKLNEITKAPFSAFFQMKENIIFCGSPERFLKRTQNKVISQPIKGTAKRNIDPIEDLRLLQNLKSDSKERAENIMIVDLVRNDLSKIALPNSVQVDELCEIYSFETVHQMISTISCEVDPKTSFTDIIRATFPMGSMTGAPKLRAMQLIDEFEDFSRGIYSGTIGYIAPNGDFDLNVVIRSMIYNTKTNYLSCPVGGAITIDSDPEKEFEECQTKISRILNM